MTPEEELIRAERAKQILEDPLVRQALDDIRAAVIEQWRVTPVKDTDLREQIWSIFNGMFKFEELLRSHIESGKISCANIAYREQQEALWPSKQ